MGTIVDYIKWRGDLEFWQDPFNEVDNLILSYIAYVNMDDIFENSNCKVFQIKEICDLYFLHTADKIAIRDKSFTKEAPNVLKSIAETKRYREIRVRNYVNQIDFTKSLQFSAMEILLPDGASYIAFRGTDDRIVGWKEDFLMSGFEVEAQKKAIEYINQVGTDEKRMIHVGGHSKGGHLAVYAAANCNEHIKKRIIHVFSNDGPGFLKEFIVSEEYDSIRSRIVRIITEDSIFGTLFEHGCEAVIIKSNSKGIMQHDPLTWMVNGAEFMRTEKLSPRAIVMEKTLKEWINGFDENEKKEFIDELFSIFEEPGVETLTELQNGGIKNLQIMARKVNTLTPSTKQKMDKILEVYYNKWVSLENENILNSNCGENSI